jgi:hypothetical protein
LFDNYDEDDEVNNADCSYGLGILWVWRYSRECADYWAHHWWQS